MTTTHLIFHNGRCNTEIIEELNSAPGDGVHLEAPVAEIGLVVRQAPHKIEVLTLFGITYFIFALEDTEPVLLPVSTGHCTDPGMDSFSMSAPALVPEWQSRYPNLSHEIDEPYVSRAPEVAHVAGETLPGDRILYQLIESFINTLFDYSPGREFLIVLRNRTYTRALTAIETVVSLVSLHQFFLIFHFSLP